MKHMVVSWMLVSVITMWPSTSFAEVPSFDPDQPFRQDFGTQMLRDFLDRALDALEDHFEMAGELSAQKDGQSGRLQLKVYPKGKSQSDEHVKAEGWFHFSPDSGRHDFHFRFQPPEASPPSKLPGDVL